MCTFCFSLSIANYIIFHISHLERVKVDDAFVIDMIRASFEFIIVEDL